MKMLNVSWIISTQLTCTSSHVITRNVTHLRTFKEDDGVTTMIMMSLILLQYLKNVSLEDDSLKSHKPS